MRVPARGSEEASFLKSFFDLTMGTCIEPEHC